VASNPFAATAETLAVFIPHVSQFMIKVNELAFDGFPLYLNILLLLGAVPAVVFHGRLTDHRVSVAWIAVVSLGVLFLVQKPMFRFPRVLLFLLPLYLMLAGAGIVYLLKKLVPGPGARRWLFPLVALIIVSAGGLSVVRSQAVTRSYSTGRFPFAKEVTLYLKDQLEPGDRVVTPRKVELSVMEYYFDLHEVDGAYLEGTVDSADRLFVIVQPWPPGDTIEDVLLRYLSPDRRDTLFGSPSLVVSFKKIKLYEVRRIESEL
jgi:hypothetical protein